MSTGSNPVPWPGGHGRRAGQGKALEAGPRDTEHAAARLVSLLPGCGVLPWGPFLIFPFGAPVCGDKEGPGTLTQDAAVLTETRPRTLHLGNTAEPQLSPPGWLLLREGPGEQVGCGSAALWELGSEGAARDCKVS